MTFEQWLAANGYDAEALGKPENEKQRKHLYAAWQAETQPKSEEKQDDPKTTFDQQMEAIERENVRRAYIQDATAAAAQRAVGNPEKVKHLRELCETAIADQKMDAKSFELAILRLDRSIGPIIMAPKQTAVNNDVLEAAVCLTEKLPSPEKHFSTQTLEVAHKEFRHGIGLKRLLLMAAQRNGYRGDDRNLKGMLRAAFTEGQESEYGSGGMMAIGPSTIAIPGILSNVANKFLRVAFESVERTWRDISYVRNANDFKTITSYSLTGDLTYDKVAPGGEIHHGTLGELSYTNKVDTYAKLIGIDRRDIINDDLGALTSVGRRLGRGAALKLNDVFWTEFLNDSTFFPTDKSKANYDDGATDSVLSLAGLENADAIFRLQTDPDGKPLGVIPRILLVPTGLRITAQTLMSSTMLAGGGNATALAPSNNVWSGAFRVVDSVYLTQTALGGSTTAWYLLADPNDLPVIEVAFLNGAEMPTIEDSELDFDRLGIAMRGYHDFGVSKQEYRAGVKLKGAS